MVLRLTALCLVVGTVSAVHHHYAHMGLDCKPHLARTRTSTRRATAPPSSRPMRPSDHARHRSHWHLSGTVRLWDEPTTIPTASGRQARPAGRPRGLARCSPGGPTGSRGGGAQVSTGSARSAPATSSAGLDDVPRRATPPRARLRPRSRVGPGSRSSAHLRAPGSPLDRPHLEGLRAQGHAAPRG